MSVIDEIAAERKRQVEVERYDSEHDDDHNRGELVNAAMAYCQAASTPRDDTSILAGKPPLYWPWEPRWWKPKNPRRDLIRAAALIVAAIERLDRADAAKAEAIRLGRGRA